MEKVSLICRDDATGADTRVHSYMVAVARKNFGELEEDKKMVYFL